MLKQIDRPLVMGIINLHGSSQSSIGRYPELDKALSYAERLYQEGADILDLGAEPTNPSFNEVISTQQELDAILSLLEKLKGFPIPISIDTSSPQVMKEAVALGAGFINDVRALQVEGALEVVAHLNIPVCLMHMAFPFSANKQREEAHYPLGLIKTIQDFLNNRINACLSAGISQQNICIDPGFGHGYFGKNLQQNLMLLQQLESFVDMGYPVMVGMSRKTFIGELLDAPFEQRLAGGLAAATLAAYKGAKIIRSHDVKETCDVVKLTHALRESIRK
jgi:dihydropteroate synthase